MKKIITHKLVDDDMFTVVYANISYFMFLKNFLYQPQFGICEVNIMNFQRTLIPWTVP